jgi:hypothetical protein
MMVSLSLMTGLVLAAMAGLLVFAAAFLASAGFLTGAVLVAGFRLHCVPDAT